MHLFLSPGDVLGLINWMISFSLSLKYYLVLNRTLDGSVQGGASSG